jgi:hypothetical protein
MTVIRKLEELKALYQADYERTEHGVACAIRSVGGYSVHTVTGQNAYRLMREIIELAEQTEARLQPNS